MRTPDGCVVVLDGPVVVTEAPLGAVDGEPAPLGPVAPGGAAAAPTGGATARAVSGGVDVAGGPASASTLEYGGACPVPHRQPSTSPSWTGAVHAHTAAYLKLLVPAGARK
jgi:hypothetical protein